jgi:hypothetical protein
MKERKWTEATNIYNDNNPEGKKENIYCQDSKILLLEY